MPFRCLLVPTGPGDDPDRRLEAALRIGMRAHAHIELMFVRPDPNALLASLPKALLPREVTAEMLGRDGNAAAQKSHDAFLDWCADNGLPIDSGHRLDSTFGSWREEIGDPGRIVAMVGRVSDLILVEKPGWTDPFVAETFDAAVFSSGRPALVVGDQVPDDLLRHVIIAWNGSLEAARTIGHTIALLHEASKITIFTASSERTRETTLADLGRYLRWHGIVVEPPIINPDGDTSVGEALLAVCEKGEATMLVMGAYTHSRVRQLLLGGVTKHALEHATIPLLVGH